MKLQMEKIEVNAKPRTLQAEWSLEEMQSIDIEQMLCDALIAEIGKELRREYDEERFDAAMSVVDELTKPNL